MVLDDIDPKKLTPMMKHWWSIKKKYPEHLLAYRMGDFFEFFYDDAERISKLIGITLTKRKIGNDSYPLAGVPHHAVTNHFTNLINQGQTIVIVDQLEDPATVKGRIVKRGVTRILSPGTVIDGNMLKSNDNNYIASLVKEKGGFGIAFADISTGEFLTTEFSSKDNDPLEKLLSIFSQYDPVELIIPSELKRDERLFLHITDLTKAIIKTYDDYVFNFEESYTLITRHFKISNLEGFGLEGSKLAIQSAGGLLAFLKETQRDIIPNIFKINLLHESNNLHLDYITQRNLELVTSLWERGKDSTLFSVFNQTHTPMGARLLKKIILQPLLNREEITRRLNIVQKFKDDIFLRSDLREELSYIGDLERFINRVNYTTRTNARDLINIKNSLENIPKIRILLEKAEIPEISQLLAIINDFKETRSLIEATIKEDSPITVKEGNIIKDGFNEKLDDLRDILNNGMTYILRYEEEQKRRWNLTSGLKVGHNNIMGYYIQITNRALDLISKIPEDYNERATLKNAKRFTTEKLKELEEKIIAAEEKNNDLEYEIFCNIRDTVVKETRKILETTKNIAIIDVLTCFAEIAEKYDYCRPKITEDDKIIIKQGRHPVVEHINISDKFIPNDCYLDTENEHLLIITGPNMAGKSTFLRQIALICIIAQMGSFVPAKSASMGIIDHIFTRIGASDDLARKLSTFMIEMTETAKILNYATPKSLIIIDELGRGTSTSDGQSIAMATLEKLHELKIKTLFSTHYHQLTEIDLPGVKNYHLDIIENSDGSINFVRKLKIGSTDKSYGIHVAKLAGIPDDVIIRAFEILEQIEKRDSFRTTVKENGNNKSTNKIYDKVIDGKKHKLKEFNTELDRLNEILDKKREDLSKKEREIEDKTKLIEELEKLNLKKAKISQKFDSKKKKYVQTNLFGSPIKRDSMLEEKLKKFVDNFIEVDLSSLSKDDLKQKLLEFKNEINKYI
ncbi:MAG: DNA mismatch repair protein MutS [Candidatus Lokiarchaeum sp. GC14_75]|nr:MAG: DNA mismatch repair protein MutS [Candidatus Lokiarchaeum sp. GC14_75]